MRKVRLDWNIPKPKNKAKEIDIAAAVDQILHEHPGVYVSLEHVSDCDSERCEYNKGGTSDQQRSGRE